MFLRFISSSSFFYVNKYATISLPVGCLQFWTTVQIFFLIGYIVKIHLSVVLTIWNILPLILTKEALIYKLQLFQGLQRIFQ